MVNKSVKILLAGVLAVSLVACGNNSKPQGSKDGSGSANDAMPAQASEGLQSARQAFWQRDLAAAEEQYRSLAEGDSASADTWGELGNVYYTQGKWKEAASAYAEAALKLIDARQMGQAVHLHRVVMSMDSEQAARIDEKLRAEFTPQAAQ